MPQLPIHLIKKIPKAENMRRLRDIIGNSAIHTVCEKAKCPNIGECYSERTCTFLILGDICVRNCAFCGINKGFPALPDPKEPENIAQAVKNLGLKYVVVTSVTRDDLPDGGAKQFAQTIIKLHALNPMPEVEVLIPDFKGDKEALSVVINARPEVLNHNIETVPRLYPKIRPQASFERSLRVIAAAKASGKIVYTKSGFMVGLGEREEEIISVLKELKNAGCDLVTIGQYLPPSRKHLPAKRYVSPEEFVKYKKIGAEIGISNLFSGPFVRSSYHASRIKNEI